MIRNLIFTVLFLLFAGIFIHSSAPSVTAGDSGEFITSATTLSLAHPPSFPLYMIMGKAWQTLIPWGAAPLKMNYFSATLGAICVSILFLIGVNLTRSPLSGLLLSFGAGFFYSFWENSLVTEVFALNTFFVCLIILLIQNVAAETGGLKIGWLALIAYLIGLGVGNHQIIIFMAPLLVLLVIFRFPKNKWGGIGIKLGLTFLLGFSIYFVLPLRSSQNPPLNWGAPKTVDKLKRTILRQDYGTLTLSLGEAPKRNLKNSLKQGGQFFRQLSKEAPWFVFLLGGLGILFGVYRRDIFWILMALMFGLSGPFFYVLGNLPFDSISEGIMGRFMIWPSLILWLGLAVWLKNWPNVARAGVGVVSLLLLFGHWTPLSAYRTQFLVWDYGNAILRSLPPKAHLFMDGGDDTFYSIAALHYGMGKRPDISAHDRGGLIFKNIYGEDFRKLNTPQKEARRIEIESKFIGISPVVYSTMNEKLNSITPFRQSGFLYEHPVGYPTISWDVIVLRSLFPLVTEDYRTRALGPFFPFMKGRHKIKEKKWEEAINLFWRAHLMGFDVDWLDNNLEYTISHLAFQLLNKGQNEEAIRFYELWIKIKPQAGDAYSNMGVAYERMGKPEKALEIYQKSWNAAPNATEPLFNMSVIYWSQKNWNEVVQVLTEVLRRNPQHKKAQHFLEAAKMKQMGEI